VTATMPADVDVRDCRLYRFYVEHPVTGEEVLGYIGETVRQPFERLLEHLATQPWFDTVVRWERDRRVFPGKRAVLAAEAAAIRAERPLYNVRENESNEDRIIPPVAIRQRRARDVERNRRRWVHPDDRATTSPTRPAHVRTERRRTATRQWSPVQVKLALWSGAWVLTWLATWGALQHYGILPTWQGRALCGSVTALLLLAWSMAGAPGTKRQRRRVRRRGRRWYR
jgi:hypothetical protein